MLKKSILVATLCAALLPGGAMAQEKLAFLIPHLFGQGGLTLRSETTLPDGSTHSAHFNSSFQQAFTPFNTALATQLAGIPLPSPASGFTYSFDSSAGVFKRSTQSFGPILSDRAETIGKKKLAVGFAYQHFNFDTIDGTDLGGVAVVFTHDSPAPGGRADVVTTSNSIEAKVSQFTAFFTYGVGDRLDLSVAIPVLSVDLKATSSATIQRIGTATNEKTHFFDPPYSATATFSNSGSASGIGDILLRAKASILKRGASGLALGLDARLPTGDEEDLLGTGAAGLKPFFVFSYSHERLSPHVKLAYQWNGESSLAGDVVKGVKGDLPDQFFWEVGVDAGLGKRLTFAADVLGRRVVDGETLVPETFQALDGKSTFPNVRFETASYNLIDGAVGIKINPGGNLLLDFNVLFKLNDAGLRAKVTPLFGIEYTF